jgi:hypothetical protein
MGPILGWKMVDYLCPSGDHSHRTGYRWRWSFEGRCTCCLYFFIRAWEAVTTFLQRARRLFMVELATCMPRDLR